ncbi:hypothetical protein NQ315_006950 [Exocentrus adspersus]|uniref:Uncharacterized protein n=1 Tax=Exocentrus adspersus TaxID=1586481 RepID=A0AAV8WC53_9CUCU|nr:hypothetical protein NQ315_006950 [Exocentrus adspersus]
MKTFAFIACFAVSCILVADAAFEDVPQSVKQAHDDCQSNPATHLDESVFKAMRKGESFDRHLAGVHMLCMNKKIGNPTTMKAFAFILCVSVSCILVAGAPPDDGAQKVKQVHDECQANPAIHLEDSVFKAIHKGEPFNRTLVGAHMLCMTTKLGTQNQDGTINREAVRRIIARDNTDDAKVDEITDKCVEQGATPEETALKLSQCIRKNTRRRDHTGEHHHHSH